MPPTIKIVAISLFLTIVLPSASLNSLAATTRHLAERLADVQRTRLEFPPLWCVSGAWGIDEEELLLADPLRGELRRYGRDGHYLGSHLSIHDVRAKKYRPSVIKRMDAGYIIEVDSAHLAWFDKGFHLSKDLDLKAVTSRSGDTAFSTYSWDASVGSLLAFGDVKLKSGEWVGALYLTSLENPSELQVLRTYPLNSKVREYALLGLALVEVIGSKGYFLALDDLPHLVEVDFTDFALPSIRDLYLIPAGFRNVPELPVNQGPEAAVHIFEGLRSATMPAGVFNHNGKLRLLLRESSFGITAWGIASVDPVARTTYLKPLAIPTSAPHLVPIQGSGESFFFVEKAEVAGFGLQKVEALISFSDW